jgi:tetrahydromethanopterin S-methyltransferase subunit G
MDRDDTSQIIAAITVMRHLEGRLKTLDARLDALQSQQKAHHEGSKRERWLGIIFGLVKTGLTFSGQISVVVSAWFCAGYVWFAHQTYVREIVAWISTHLSWLS